MAPATMSTWHYSLRPSPCGHGALGHEGGGRVVQFLWVSRHGRRPASASLSQLYGALSARRGCTLQTLQKKGLKGTLISALSEPSEGTSGGASSKWEFTDFRHGHASRKSSDSCEEGKSLESDIEENLLQESAISEGAATILKGSHKNGSKIEEYVNLKFDKDAVYARNQDTVELEVGLETGAGYRRRVWKRAGLESASSASRSLGHRKDGNNQKLFKKREMKIEPNVKKERSPVTAGVVIGTAYRGSEEANSPFRRDTTKASNEMQALLQAMETAGEGELESMLLDHLLLLPHEGQVFRALVRLINELSARGRAKLALNVLVAFENMHWRLSENPAAKGTNYSNVFVRSTEPSSGADGAGGRERREAESGERGVKERPEFMKDLYTHVLSILAKGRELNLSLKLMEFMEKRGLKADVVTYNVLLLAYCEGGKVREAEILLDKMRRKGSRNGSLRRAPEVTVIEEGKGEVGEEGNGALSTLNGAEKGDREKKMDGSREAETDVQNKKYGATTSTEKSPLSCDRTAAAGLVKSSESRGLLGHNSPVADIASFNTLLRAYASMGDWRKAEGLLEIMVQEGLTPDYISFTRVIEACSKAGQWRRCEAYLEAMNGRHLLSEYAASVVMQALGRAGHWEKAREVLLLLQASKVAKPKVQTYNIYLNACRETGQWKAAMEALDWMQGRGLCPNEVTYGAIIGVCRKAGQWKLALEFFGKMEEAKLAPSKMTFTEVVMVYADADKPDRALALLERAGERGLVLDAALYNAAMAAFAKANRLQEVQSCWKAMEAQGCKATIVSYNTMLDALGKDRQLQQALQLFKTMQERGVQLEVQTFNVLLNACAAQRDMRTAMELFAELHRQGLRADQVTFNIMLKICGRCGQGMRATEVYSRMIQAGLRTDGATISAYLPALEASGLVGEALDLYESAKSEGLWSGPYVGFWYAKVIGACVAGKDMDAAMAMYHHMLEDGVEPWAQTFLGLLRGCEMTGAWQHALYIMDEFRTSLRRTLESKASKGAPMALGQREPGVEAYNMAIGACDGGGRPKEALRLFYEMEERGVMPTVATYAVVVRALQNGGLWKEALEVYGRIPLSKNLRNSPPPMFE